MKKTLSIVLSVLVMSAFALSACSSTAEAAPAPSVETVAPSLPQENGGYGNGAANPGGGRPDDVGDMTQEITPAGDLTDAEIESLLLMREEEKLARDVYLTLYDVWGLPVFKNIASSEQQHTDSVKSLLDAYGIEDPVQDDTIGVFTNANLQAICDDLTAQGKESQEAALRVGAAIEEIDILDLQDGLAETSDPNITMVYNRLMSGSYNHLRAFVSQIEQQTGETYVPQYLSPEAYAEILSAPMGMGQGGGRGRGAPAGGGCGKP